MYSFEEPTYVPIVYIFAIKYLNAVLFTSILRVIMKSSQCVKRIKTLHTPLFSKICDDVPC